MKKLIPVLLVLLVSVSLASAEELTLTIDKEKGEVIIPAEINGKYLVSPTKHAVSYYKGGNGEKAVMRALVSEIDYYL